MSDFTDLLDAIKTAKSILEPSRIDEIRETYKLEKEQNLAVENLKISRDELKVLQEKKEKSLESLSALERKKFSDIISPDTGAASQIVKNRSMSYEGLTDRLDSQIKSLSSEIKGIQGVSAAKEQSSKDLVDMAGDYQTAGWDAVLFEQADFDVAADDYRQKLTDQGDFNEDQIAMRMFFFNNAYLEQHKINYQEQFTTQYNKSKDALNLSYLEWKSYASPTTIAGGGAVVPGAGIPSQVEQGWNVLQNRIMAQAEIMGGNKTWTPDNAPIKLNTSTNKYELDTDKFDKLKETYNDLLTSSTSEFLSAGDIESAMRLLYDPQGAAIHLTGKDAILPGESFGNVVFQSAFDNIVRFYEAPDIKDVINRQTINAPSMQKRIYNLLGRTK